MQYEIERPKIVERATALAKEFSFDIRPGGNSPASQSSRPSCCIDEMGALLSVLSASIDSGLVGEIGSGAGVGTAWLASGLRSSSRLLTVEIEPQLAEAVRSQFAEDPRIQVLTGDWRSEFSSRGPFDLLFADGGGAGSLARSEWEFISNLLKPGGILTIDDLTPEECWPGAWVGKPDPKREFAFRSGLFVATEVRLRSDVSALVMSRK